MVQQRNALYLQRGVTIKGQAHNHKYDYCRVILIEWAVPHLLKITITSIMFLTIKD